MATVSVDRVIDAPVAEVWKSWDDFGNISVFHPLLKSSHLLGAQQTGKGATRQCDLKDGNSIQERIIEYVPHERLVVDIYNGTLPLRRAIVTFVLTPMGQKTNVKMSIEFAPKYGPMGALMVPLMKPQFRKMMLTLLDGNAVHVEGVAA
ncbi:MAG: SRPBCC family protein [Pseudomonadota bacterium]